MFKEVKLVFKKIKWKTPTKISLASNENQTMILNFNFFLRYLYQIRKIFKVDINIQNHLISSSLRWSLIEMSFFLYCSRWTKYYKCAVSFFQGPWNLLKYTKGIEHTTIPKHTYIIPSKPINLESWET